MRDLSQSAEQALGLRDDHVQAVIGSVALGPDTLSAWQSLWQRGRRQGFDLRIASGFRSYSRQLAIFNAKASGERPVCDDHGACLSRAAMDSVSWLQAILRFSALPGTSRHHWGSDLDIFDAAAVAQDYPLQLTPAEYRGNGPFAAMSEWLADCMARDEAEGFFQPYAIDRGGVAPEPWHVSHRDTARSFAKEISPELLLPLWRGQDVPLGVTRLALCDEVVTGIDALWRRYITLDC